MSTLKVKMELLFIGNEKNIRQEDLTVIEKIPMGQLLVEKYLEGQMRKLLWETEKN
jgi:hypothetical protein